MKWLIIAVGAYLLLKSQDSASNSTNPTNPVDVSSGYTGPMANDPRWNSSLQQPGMLYLS